MTDEIANLSLEYMRTFERALADMRADMFDLRDELQAINRRLSHRGRPGSDQAAPRPDRGEG